jgi:putative FmdB family regulatory protein
MTIPTYTYLCSDCGHEFDIFQTFAEPNLTMCDHCQGSLNKVLYPPIVFDATPRTLGTIAERNTTRGKYEIQEKRYKDKKEYFDAKVAAEQSLARRTGGTAPQREFDPDPPKVDLSLARLSPEKKAKYIMEGKK